jgi:hypothetical protein
MHQLFVVYSVIAWFDEISSRTVFWSIGSFLIRLFPTDKATNMPIPIKISPVKNTLEKEVDQTYLIVSMTEECRNRCQMFVLF